MQTKKKKRKKVHKISISFSSLVRCRAPPRRSGTSRRPCAGGAAEEGLLRRMAVLEWRTGVRGELEQQRRCE